MNEEYDKMFISETIEDKYGIYIDTHTEVPLTIGYGEVAVLDSDLVRETTPVCGGLCFSIEKRFSSEHSFHPIMYWSTLSTPNLSFFNTPFTSAQQHDRNAFARQYSRYNSISTDSNSKIWKFFSSWSRSKNSFLLCGKEEDLTLHVHGDDSGTSVLEIKLLSARDYYTVAAWFVLVEANKYIMAEDQAPIFEDYWPTCRDYYKPINTSEEEPQTSPKSHSAELFKKNNLTLYGSEEDLLYRESSSPLPFTHLITTNMIGYYDEDRNPCFFSDVNIVNTEYGDGVLRFEIVSDNCANKFNAIRDFTFSMYLIIVHGNGNEITKSIYLGDESQDESDDILTAETVNAPYASKMPIVLECKLYKREKGITSKYEASVLKTRINEAALDENGKLNVKKAWPLMTWEGIAEENNDA